MVIWAGQFLSILGSGISSFGLSIWVLARTGSNTGFALSFLFQVLPGILFAPLAGSFADRYNRKRILIITDSLDALLKLLMIYLLYFDHMQLVTVYIILFISSTLGTLQGPAFESSVPQIVPKEQLGRANGLRQLTGAVQSLISPVVAGALYPFIGLVGLIAIDFFSFVLAILTVLVSHIPQPLLKGDESKLSVWADLKFAVSIIREKTGFMELIVMTALLNFVANISMVLIGPIVLSNYSPAVFGLINSISGLAMMVGGLLAGLFPVKDHKVRAIFRLLMFAGIGLSIMGLSPEWYVIALGFFLFMLPIPFANGTLGTLIQSKFPNEVLGRVSSVILALLKIVTPLAFLMAGFLSDVVFNPLLKQGGILSSSLLGNVIGVGPQRGSALLLVISGFLLVLVCLSILKNQKVMSLEIANPDVLGD